MTPERFERVAARFERLSTASPRAYRALVVGIGLVGFAVLGGLVGTSALLLAAVVAAAVLARNVLLVKVAIPLAVTTWVLVRALWVRFERPGGLALAPGEFPALFAEIERLRRLGAVPRLHRVLLVDDLNAGVQQTPRLGIAGPTHNDLVLGLPLMLALPPDAFRAVLAHELGHLSGRHGRVGAWIYRVRRTWMQVLSALAARGSRLARALGPFFGWYGPFFAAASRALAREQEREADRFSAAATDPRTAADALAGVAVADFALERRFWPEFARAGYAQARPPDGYLEAMGRALQEAPRDPAAAVTLERALRRRSRGEDTHPALADRLAALGQPPRVPAAPLPSAAEHYLGPALPALRAALDARWREGLLARWEALRDRHEARVRRLAALEDAAAARALDADEAWEHASLVEDLRGVEAALPLARAAVERHPDHAPSRFGLGRMLLGEGRRDGVGHLERAVALDRDAEPAAAQLLAAFHVAEGQDEAARPWIARAAALEQQHEAARAERSTVRVGDRLDPHALGAEAAGALTAPLRGHPRVARAWLARKRLRHLPDRAPVFVVAVEPRRRFWQLERAGDAPRLARELAELLPSSPPAFVVVRDRSNGALFRRARRLAGARVA